MIRREVVGSGSCSWRRHLAIVQEGLDFVRKFSFSQAFPEECNGYPCSYSWADI